MSDYLKKRQEHILQGRPLKVKEKKGIAKVSEKRKAKLAEQKESGSDKSLDQWFNDIEKKHWGYLGICKCMECGQDIPLKYARHATAHLLPKKIFKSVATHELNYLILCAGNGCHDKTHRVDKFVTMKIWANAASRIKQLIPLLPFDELRHISNQLDIALENTEP